MLLYIKVLAVAAFATLTLSCANNPPAPVVPSSFEEFRLRAGNPAKLADLSRYLTKAGVRHVVPLHQLLQQGTSWQSHRQQRYAVPPPEMWPNMVRTLKLLDRFIIPAIGPVKVVSGFRTPLYNQLAGGAPRSRHLNFSAVDVIPAGNLTRRTEHNRILRLWHIHGSQLEMGLGIYQSNRIHIDTGGYRKWQG